MSNRVKGFTVVLDQDYKDEDAEYIKNALEMVKGVQEVSSSVVDHNDWILRQRIQMDMKKRILDAVDNQPLQ